MIDVQYDSQAFQFWGSELYRNGIPLTDPRAPGANRRELAAYADRARALNARNDGDQIAVVLG
ncbi:MAG TPA: hypothetical protein VGI30_02585 [Caulobacteraceae bacterium]